MYNKLGLNMFANRIERFSSSSKSQEIANAADYITHTYTYIPNTRKVMLIHPSFDRSIELLVSFVNAL